MPSYSYRSWVAAILGTWQPFGEDANHW